jgi:uncharacterized DUF497 family protein
MQFDWNSANVNHIALHGVTPEEAEQVIKNDPLDAGVAIRNREARTVHLGETDAGRVLVVIATERDNMCRIVTARPADRKERKFYSAYKETFNEDDSTDPSLQD